MAWGTKSRHERGYGAAWAKLRPQIMERDCSLCQCDGPGMEQRYSSRVSSCRTATPGWCMCRSGRYR
jgi:hypothetical protein